MFKALGTGIRRSRRMKEQRGQTLVIFAGGLVMFLGMVGLAIDAGRAYVVNAQLSKAVDAAVLAGAKVSGNRAQIMEVVRRTMRINFPQNYMGARDWPQEVNLQVDFNYPEPVTNYSTRRIVYTARATVPTTFLRVLNFTEVPITKSATALRRVLDIIIVADRSTSIGEGPFAKFKEAIQRFVENFDTANDRVGMLTFAGHITWLEPRFSSSVGFNKDQLLTSIRSADMAGWTASGPALEEAYGALIDPNNWVAGQANRWKVILFFTDGTPNVINIDPRWFRFQHCTNRARVPSDTREFCGVFELCRENVTFDSAHLTAGEADHPYPPNRTFIFGLIRHLNPDPRNQDNRPYREYGFTDPEDRDLRQGPEYPPHGSQIESPDPLYYSCEDPRHLIGSGLRTPNDRRRALDPPVNGQELPPRDAYKGRYIDGNVGVPLTAVTRGSQLVSKRDVEFLLPLGETAFRWNRFRYKINGAARNNLENVADMIRQPRTDIPGFDQGVTIFTIGLDGLAGQMTRYNDEFQEIGKDICQRVANVPAAGPYYNPNQPEGLFVHAANESDLAEAFNKVSNAILRLLN